MYWIPGTPIKKYELPEGYSFSNFRCTKDRDDWVEICRKGLVSDGDRGYCDFGSAIASRKDLDPETDMFFLDFNGEHIGTVTVYVHSEDNTGDVHMVSIREDYRGRGLAKYLNMKALEYFEDKDVRYVHLTTDEWRKGAVKGYISAGFLPVEYDIGMEERWSGVLEDIGVDSIDMLNDDTSFYKTIVRRSKMTAADAAAAAVPYEKRLEAYRNRLDEIDGDILSRFERRMAVAAEIGRLKKDNGAAICDSTREQEVIKKAAGAVNPEYSDYAAELMKKLIELSKSLQNEK